MRQGRLATGSGYWCRPYLDGPLDREGPFLVNSGKSGERRCLAWQQPAALSDRVLSTQSLFGIFYEQHRLANATKTTPPDPIAAPQLPTEPRLWAQLLSPKRPTTRFTPGHASNLERAILGPGMAHRCTVPMSVISRFRTQQAAVFVPV